LLLGAGPVAGAGLTLESAKALEDPKAAERVVREADTAEGLLVMLAAAALHQSGQRDKAVFWFYAGQLRSRYSPQLQGENAQIVTIYAMSLGEPINAHAFRDIPGLIKTLSAVVAWDEKTFAKWAAAMKLDPADPKLLERRKQAIAGLGPYKEKLLAERKQLEDYARNYKTPAEMEKERQALIDRTYSQAPAEVNVRGTRFRVPAHYLSPQGAVYKPDMKLTDIGFWVFLPDFGGYTRSNWKEPGSNPNAILVRVTRPERGDPAAQVEAFLAEGGGVTEEVSGLKATVYDSQKTRAPFPVVGTSRHYAFKGTRARGGPYYTVCDAPRPNIIQKAPRCEMFLGGADRDLRISAFFRREHLPRMAEIEKRLSAMLSEWMQ
jgi:hypothetical protein